MTLVERLNNLIEVSEVKCERDLYLECRDRIERYEAALREILDICCRAPFGKAVCADGHRRARKALGEE